MHAISVSDDDASPIRDAFFIWGPSTVVVSRYWNLQLRYNTVRKYWYLTPQGKNDRTPGGGKFQIFLFKTNITRILHSVLRLLLDEVGLCRALCVGERILVYRSCKKRALKSIETIYSFQYRYVTMSGFFWRVYVLHIALWNWNLCRLRRLQQHLSKTALRKTDYHNLHNGRIFRSTVALDCTGFSRWGVYSFNT